MALGGPAGGPQPTAARASHVDTPRAQAPGLSQEARLTPTVAASGLEGLTPVGFTAHWVGEEGRTGNVNPRGQWSAGHLAPRCQGGHSRGAGPFCPIK